MKKAWLAAALGLTLCFPLSAWAADNTMVGVGTGAVAGAVVGGPVGALVGAVAGGFIGSNTDSARPRYRRRARAASRRRYGARPAPARFASDDGRAPQATVRRAAAGAPSEVSPTPETTTGSMQGGWRDPR